MLSESSVGLGAYATDDVPRDLFGASREQTPAPQVSLTLNRHEVAAVELVPTLAAGLPTLEAPSVTRIVAEIREIEIHVRGKLRAVFVHQDVVAGRPVPKERERMVA